MNKLKTVVGVRLSDELVEKLDLLAVSTYRGRADVLRFLIDGAQISGNPDLASLPLGPAKHAAEAG